MDMKTCDICKHLQLVLSFITAAANENVEKKFLEFIFRVKNVRFQEKMLTLTMHCDQTEVSLDLP